VVPPRESQSDPLLLAGVRHPRPESERLVIVGECLLVPAECAQYAGPVEVERPHAGLALQNLGIHVERFGVPVEELQFKGDLGVDNNQRWIERERLAE